MLPVSGAEQLNGSPPIGERPIISQMLAYSRLVSDREMRLRQKHVPQAGLLRLGLEFLHDRRRLPAVLALVELAVIDRLGRDDVLLQERLMRWPISTALLGGGRTGMGNAFSSGVS